VCDARAELALLSAASGRPMFASGEKRVIASAPSKTDSATAAEFPATRAVSEQRVARASDVVKVDHVGAKLRASSKTSSRGCALRYLRFQCSIESACCKDQTPHAGLF